MEPRPPSDIPRWRPVRCESSRRGITCIAISPAQKASRSATTRSSSSAGQPPEAIRVLGCRLATRGFSRALIGYSVAWSEETLCPAPRVPRVRGSRSLRARVPTTAEELAVLTRVDRLCRPRPRSQRRPEQSDAILPRAGSHAQIPRQAPGSRSANDFDDTEHVDPARLVLETLCDESLGLLATGE